MEELKTTKGLVAATLLGAAVVLLIVMTFGSSAGTQADDFPNTFWCIACKGSVSLDYDRRKLVPATGNNTGAYLCPLCPKGAIYSTAQCSECKSAYLDRTTGEPGCPKCLPELAEAAKAKNIDPMPAEIQP